MASQLRPEDRIKILKGVTKKVGDKPYESGYWGDIAARDYVLVELLDESGVVIDYKDLTIAEAGIEVVDEQFKLLPGSHLTAFGFETGTFRIRYRFIRNLAGVEKPMLLRTKAGFENNIFELNSDASNIYIANDNKIYGVSEEEYLQNPETAEQLFLTNFKYEVDAISNSRTEIRLRAKNIFDNSYLGEYRYQSDFLKLQESMKIENVSSAIEFIGVLDIPANQTAGGPPPPVNFDITQDLKITSNNGGFAFTDNMEGGTLTLPNAYIVGYNRTEVRTDLNILPNDTFEEVVLDLTTGEPKDISGIGWDPSLHSDAVEIKNWSSGYANGTGVHAGTEAIGYHAKFVRNEGNSGGVCLKFIDQNDAFVDLPDWPTLNSHRRMMVGTTFTNLDGFGASPGDVMNISLDMKSTVAGKGVTFQMAYPADLVVEDVPVRPPEGYYDPASPGPFESQPEDPPEGFVPNTAAGASTLETKPPSSIADLIVHFNISPPAYFAEVGHTTSLPILGGSGYWKVTNINGGSIEWSPNVPDSFTKAGTLSQLTDWEWDGSQWVESGLNVPASLPSPPANTVSPVDYSGFDVVNAHPFQQTGQGGYARFKRNTFRGDNRGWQTGTNLAANDNVIEDYTSSIFKSNNAFMLIKDDLIWLIAEPNYTANSDKIFLTTFDEIFPSIHEVLVDDGNDGEHSIYEDIFKQGRIQSITRRKTSSSSNGVKANTFIVFYNDGRSTEDSNKVMEIKAGPGASNVVEFFLLKELDEGFNTTVSNAGGYMEWSYGKDYQNEVWRHWACVKGTNRLFFLDDGDGDFFEREDGQWFVQGEDSGESNSFQTHFQGVDDNYFEVWFSARHSSNHWSNYSGLPNPSGPGGGSWINLKEDESGVAERIPLVDWAYNAGIVGTEGAELEFGSRNPGAANYNPNAIYDDGSTEFDFDEDPLKIGTLSSEEQWEWDGYEWNSVGGSPTYTYERLNVRAYTTQAGSWDTYNIQAEIPENWNPLVTWYFYIRGHDSFSGENQNGTVWVDNVFADFTLTQQQVTTPIYSDFTAKITNVVDSSTIRVNRNYNDVAAVLIEENTDVDTLPTENTNPITFDNFKLSYLVYNPYDLRTYLKFGNQMFLTTNFKKDIASNGYPFSVVYKLYESLPAGIEESDELTVVKEMADVVEERVRIVDFVDTEVGDVVLKTPDVSNAENPIQRVTTNYKTQTDILSEDSEIANSLSNQFLSQSMDSAEINVDYSKFENFINFSSAKVRIENFKYKLEQIEAETAKSASYVGVSGSSLDMSKALNKIDEYKNGFDTFEKYMYFESSSYESSSLGQFFDNAWPKVPGGNGSFESPYVLASTTSDQASNWYIKQVASASSYDTDNLNKLSNLLPEHIKFNSSNQTYLRMIDMFGQHFDDIWIYIKALGDTYDRREKLTEGISKDLLESVGKSLGWQLNDGKSTTSLSKFALGKEVTGSSYSNYSVKSEQDNSREIWSRIINNMPFFLKNKGTIRAIKGLINIYGIPPTILRVKEYGGPDLPDDAVPQFEISRKFTKALGFRGAQFVSSSWIDDVDSGRKPDTIEFRFKSPTGSNQILVEKHPIGSDVSSSFYIKLKDNNSPDNYGYVAFQISGSDGMKEISSSNLPVYDNDFYSVMVRRTSGSDNPNVSQSFELSVGKYDAGRSKIHLYSTSTLVTDVASSASYNANWETDGNIYIGGSGSIASTDIGVQFSGSIMEYRHWTEVLNTGSFKNHIANPKAYNGNSLSSSYENLVLRYSFDDNKDLSSDTDGIRDTSANQTFTMPGVHNGFTGNFFGNVVDQTKTHIPSIGALRRVTNKIRIEANVPKPGAILSYKERATKSAYDLAPVDSNKIGVYFAPTDVINTDIIESVANLNFDNYLGDPRDVQKLEYRGLKSASNNYWKKYNSPNDFWDYIRMLKYYDQSIFPQIRKMIPARAKANLGILVEPNIFERPKVIIGKDPVVETPIYRDTIKIMDDFVEVTSSYNHDRYTITDYDAYNSTINLYGIESGSAAVSMSAVYKTYEGNVTGFMDEVYKNTIWQRIGEEGAYKSGSVTTGDVKFAEVLQPVISGSRIYGNNQKIMKFYNHPTSASLGIAYSSSFYNVDIDNLVEHCQAKFDAYYAGVKNTKLTTFDGGPPIEVTITSPTRLVKSKGGESSLNTGEGKVAKFLPKKKKKKKGGFFQQAFAKTKPSTIQKAIKQAEEDKGDFLTFQETMKVVNKFKKDNNLKK